MADEIRSIYEHLKDDKMATLSDYAGAKTYAFKSSGVREKILEINREENRLPTDHTHIGLERYCYAQSPILTVADALKVVGKQISPLAREVQMCLLMDENAFPTALYTCGVGAQGKVELFSREFLKALMLTDAKKVLLVHNHPFMGSIWEQFHPSVEDFRAAQHMTAYLKLYGIEVMDSVIVSEYYDEERKINIAAMYSLKEKKIYELGVEPENHYYSSELERIANSNHAMEYDLQGMRVTHKEAVLAQDGLHYTEERDL